MNLASWWQKKGPTIMKYGVPLAMGLIGGFGGPEIKQQFSPPPSAPATMTSEQIEAMQVRILTATMDKLRKIQPNTVQVNSPPVYLNDRLVHPPRP